MDVNGELHAPAAVTSEKTFPVPSGQCESCGEEKIVLYCHKTKRISQQLSPERSCYTV